MAENKVLEPSPELLIALGSMIVHYEEFLSDKGNPVDLVVINDLRNQSIVKEWMDGMAEMAFLPLKR
jgi:hypothetical protein